MPFGLHGAPATFQRMMDRILQGTEEFAAALMDDIIIFSETWDEHLEHVREVLERLRGRTNSKTLEVQSRNGRSSLFGLCCWRRES